MKLSALFLSLTSLFAVKVLSQAMHNWASLPDNGSKFISFKTDVKSVPEFSPNQTYWAAIAWNNGYMGMQTWANKRVFLFSLWDNNNGKATIVETCKECVTSRFGNEGTGSHMQYFYPWLDGVDYGFRIDYEEDGDYLVYTAQLRIDGEWMQFGKLRVINDNLNSGLGYFYQFLENPQGISNGVRVGVWSKQAYRREGSKYWYPALGGSITYTYPGPDGTWGSGLTENQTAIWMSINGPAGYHGYNNKPEQWQWYPYDADNLGIDIVVANKTDRRCGWFGDVMHQCQPGYCCSSYGYCGTTDAYCKGSSKLEYDAPVTKHRPQVRKNAKAEGVKTKSHMHSGPEFSKFKLANNAGSCTCTRDSADIYIDDFLVAYQNQGYLWDEAAWSSGSALFDYKGKSAAGKDYDLHVEVQTQKPMKEGEQIGGPLYECFQQSEKQPSWSNVQIPKKCILDVDSVSVIATFN
ncbi:hypothetical protein K493DRAFT_364892 [Basidiobolus meristosporus CBS 931.73]|uniref:Chitin-binding type-1 domain-containing protein n=1 Tax=Basidiobolus meristosporus CBS 931.73 TaxID=1314790 RepID=A0A1Y1VUU9_9FUNG|nr:hypothetical protein K493DRAFT_364892 [Basidiobolus meristosporus CBS 931.73]|eukprot:ORX64534.1 hypothetical protein K493DRAFT_364892 [Basidiobolus meristosporus CBS 931.73]